MLVTLLGLEVSLISFDGSLNVDIMYTVSRYTGKNDSLAFNTMSCFCAVCHSQISSHV